MKRYVAIAVSLCLLAGVYCLTPAKAFVNTAIVIVAGRLGFNVSELAWRLDVPLDEAMAQRPRDGRYKEYTVADSSFDVLIYYFDGDKRDKPTEVASNGLKAIRKGGFAHRKKMTLLIFCNLTATEKTRKAVYPYGLFLESAAIINRGVSISEMARGPLIQSPMNWDYRINEWTYTTNNASKAGPEIRENPAYTPSTNALEAGWFMDLRNLTNKTQVYTKFAAPRYYVREGGAYSEVYPVYDTSRSQAETVRIWYDAEKVTNAGCYMTNKYVC
jgi:hypothetical protein